MELFFESIVGFFALFVGIGFIILAVYIYFAIKESEYLQMLLLTVSILFCVSVGIHEENEKTISFGILLLLVIGTFWLLSDGREKGIKISLMIAGVLIAISIGCLTK